MPAIENLLRRWGFVKLSRYGLVLTPEGRIMSLRPAVLDDGMGGRIVGWRDRDLAQAELSPWPAAKPSVASLVAGPARVSPPIAATGITPLAQPAPAAIPQPAPETPTVSVAPAEEPEEDEWEWEIALARARAAAEETTAAAPVPAPAPAPATAASAVPTRPSRRMRVDTMPPPPPATVIAYVPPPPPRFIDSKTEPMAARSPIDTGDWPKTEPLGNIDYEDYTNPVAEVVRVVRLAKPTVIPARTIVTATPPAPVPAVRAYPRAESPKTIIPIPKLPRAEAHAVQPVVRTRFPKATPPALQTQRPPTAPVIVPPPIRPAEDDRTSPGIVPAPALPRIPSITRAR